MKRLAPPVSKLIRDSFVAALGFSLAFLMTADFAFAAPQPSWFPKISCKQAWKNKDLAAFDHSTDTKIDPSKGNVGYAGYSDRLKKSGVDRSSCYKDWTVLVYMAADNDLSPYALWDLHEMEGAFVSGRMAGSTLKTDLLVQMDTKGPTGVRRLHVFQAPGTKYVVPKGKQDFEGASPTSIFSPLVEFRAETKPATASEHKARLREFLDWGMRKYPAERYFVIVWGHGQGWASEPVPGSVSEPEPESRYVDQKDLPITFDDLPDVSNPAKEKSPFSGRFGGLVFSEIKNDYLGIPSLSAVLKETVEHTLEGRPIDVYAADACLMQMAEVAYEISESARFVVGSAQVQSFLGLPYRRLLYEINTGKFDGANALVGKSDEAYLVARMLPQLAQKSLDPVHGQQGRADKEASKTFTMSAISSVSLRNELAPAIDRLGLALSAYIDEDPLRTMDLRFLMKSTPNFMSGARELGSFLGLLDLQLREEAIAKGKITKAAQRVSDAVRDLRKAVGLTVVSYGFGTGYRNAAEPLHLLGFRSLGIWLPQTPQEFAKRLGDFEQSSLYRDSEGAWANWLKAAFD